MNIEEFATWHGLTVGQVSDGYHTFDDLYNQRLYLFATIVNLKSSFAWKSKKHEDETIEKDARHAKNHTLVRVALYVRMYRATHTYVSPHTYVCIASRVRTCKSIHPTMIFEEKKRVIILYFSLHSKWHPFPPTSYSSALYLA